jgi:hypothetical protein
MSHWDPNSVRLNLDGEPFGRILREIAAEDERTPTQVLRLMIKAEARLRGMWPESLDAQRIAAVKGGAA